MALDRLTKVDGGGISTTSDYRVGIITATKFVGPIEGDVTGSITATDGTFSGNVTIGGTLTYEDVTNIDSVGLVTARDGIFIPDNKKLQLGNAAGSSDLEIYHDSAVNRIDLDQQLIIRKAGSGPIAKFIPDGAVQLYHNNLLRLETDANGVQVKPNIGGITQLGIAQTTTTAYSINGSISFINANNTTAQIQGRTGAASTTGDILFLCNTVGDESLAILEDGKVRVPDRGSFVVGQGNDLTLKHDTNSSITNTTGQLAIENTAANISIKASNTNGDIIMRAGGGTSSENAIVAVHHGEVVLSFNGATKLSTTATGVTIDGTVAATSYTGDGSNITGIVAAGISSTAFTQSPNSSNSGLEPHSNVSVGNTIGMKLGFNYDNNNQYISLRTAGNYGRNFGSIKIRTDKGHSTNSVYENGSGASFVMSNSNGDLLLQTMRGQFNVGEGSGGYEYNGFLFKLDGTMKNCCSSSAGENIRIQRRSNGNTIEFGDTSSNTIGSITLDTSANTTTYNTSSDYRIKENVVGITSALDKINQLRPVNFNFIGKSVKLDGFIAHEVQVVVPYAVHGQKDAVKTVKDGDLSNDGSYEDEVRIAALPTKQVPVYQQVDYSKLVGLLTASIQELSAKNDALEERIKALEGP